MKNIPSNFQFNQSNLQDFSDCRRRFYLRYVLKLAWPAAEAEPIMENEKWMRQGTTFHHMIHQFILGVPEIALSRQAALEPIQGWWQNFIGHTAELPGLHDAEARRLSEFSLTAHVGSFSLIAKFDLLIIMPDTSILIYDWKTSRQRPKRSTLDRRLQTLVYPLVASLCSPELLKSPSAKPPQISMIYWFTEFPSQPEIFTFDQNHLANNRQNLETQMATITRLVTMGEEAFPLTVDKKKCTYCVYRSLCDRGQHAGAFSETNQESDLPEFELDLEQIGEIEY